MEYRPLGTTDMKVSAICLGTMTWGEQNSEAEAHAQLDAALEAGVNFIDTAEMYPIPPKGETQGRTEAYIGNWLTARGTRDKVILATKVVGKTNGHPWLRDGTPRLDRANVEQALNDSLKRLRTDYVDLYQLHWPDRSTNYFGQLGYTHKPEDDSTPLEETLEVLGDFVRAGKIRSIGVSNETPWGLMTFLHLAKARDLPPMVSIQNPYNLLNRSFEVGNAEIAVRERCGLLAYSPMAFGTLSGKYLNGQKPRGSRLALFPGYKRYDSPNSRKAIERYVAIARQADLDPAQMALAFVTNRVFVTATIIGATTLSQLTSDIASIDVHLSDDVLDAIEAVHKDIPNPAP